MQYEDINPKYLEQIDFETFQQSIPEFDEVSPYMQIPFQYSLQYIEKENGRFILNKIRLPALYPNDPELDYHNLLMTDKNEV